MIRTRRFLRQLPAATLLLTLALVGACGDTPTEPAPAFTQTDLRAGSVLELEGLGQRYSGRYFVTATTHSIGDDGYTTQFNCRREEV